MLVLTTNKKLERMIDDAAKRAAGETARQSAEREARPATQLVVRVPRAANIPTIDRESFRNACIAIGLQKLFDQKWFDICTFDALCEAARIVPDGDLYRLLRPLHCVHWRDMPSEIREQVRAVVLATFTEEVDGDA